ESYPPPTEAPAAFLDRDGTLCKHVQYLSDPKQFELLPGVEEALQALQSAGFRLVIVTNQPGIGFGYFSNEDFYRVNLEMLRQLSAGGILIDKIYFSPYTKAEGRPCRKPGTLLGERAIQELNLIREDSIMFGDSDADVGFAKNLGCMSCLIAEDSDNRQFSEHFTAKSLLDGVRLFLDSREKVDVSG
ncbi:MAG: HAD family hydrolase, partial [Bdellovibrionales bacterium]|nr:HAD family hydrolase [Bdellovibrionales bacterium]